MFSNPNFRSFYSIESTTNREEALKNATFVINAIEIQPRFGLLRWDYPKGLAALLRTQASVQDLVVEAILQKSKKVALQALLADPVVNSISQAEKVLNSMLKLQEKYIQIKLD